MKRLTTLISILFVAITMSACAQSSASLFGPKVIGFTWDASPSTNVMGYKLYVFTNNPVVVDIMPIQVVPTTNTLATVTNFLTGTNYWLCVTAVDAVGVESAPSNVLTVQVQKNPGVLRIVR